MMSILFAFAAFVMTSDAQSEPLIVSLPDDAFTASSYWGAGTARAHCFPPAAKTSSHGTDGYEYEAWCAAESTLGQWLQIDLGNEYTIDAVAVIARCCRFTTQFVKTYTLLYSTDGTSFTEYQGGEILQGPQTSGGTATVSLQPAITARFLKFSPLTWSGHVSMRVEAYGVLAGSTAGCTTSLADACETINANSESIAAQAVTIADLQAEIDEIKSDLRAEGSERQTRFAAAPGSEMIDVGNNANRDVVNWSYKYIVICSLLLANLTVMMYSICTSSGKRSHGGKQYRVQYNEDTEAEAINM